MNRRVVRGVSLGELGRFSWVSGPELRSSCGASPLSSAWAGGGVVGIAVSVSLSLPQLTCLLGRCQFWKNWSSSSEEIGSSAIWVWSDVPSPGSCVPWAEEDRVCLDDGGGGFSGGRGRRPGLGGVGGEGGCSSSSSLGITAGRRRAMEIFSVVPPGIAIL